MKTLTSNYLARNDLELFCKIILVSSIMILIATSYISKNNKVESIKVNNIYDQQFGDFDRIHIKNKPATIAKMISVLKPDFNSEKINNLSRKIHQAFFKYHIEPQIVVAIIDTESHFNQQLVSASGDFSMAQVNIEIWNKEFNRLNMKLIDSNKIKNDQAYSLEIMAQILHILKNRYEKKDRRWYARYHSKNMKHKIEYLSKLHARMKLIEQAKVIAYQ